jgi:hypothetical protein
MGEKIIAVKKDQNGDIAEVMTHTGRVISIEQAMKEAAEGKFDSITSLDKEGNWTIANSAGDGQPESGNNLDMLPSFAEAMHEGDNLQE